MVNYNFDSPKERGFWYDGTITKKVSYSLGKIDYQYSSIL